MPKGSAHNAGANAGMTPEAQQAKMSEERAFLTNLFESALANKGQEVQRLLLTYGLEHKIMAHKVLGEFKDGSGRTALHFACQSQVKDCDADDALTSESTLNEKEKKKDKASLDIVELLLTRCNFPSSAVISLLRMKDKDGLTPLMLASQNPSYKRIKCIVDLGGSKVTLARSKAGATALHYAAGAGASRAVIEELYNNGKAALESSSLQGGTPLHWASGIPPTKDYSETILALLNCGANVDAPNESGISCLILAAASSNDAHAKILVKHGADRGVILGGNITVFHIAADLNLVGTLAALLEVDSDNNDEDSMSSICLKKKNDKGETPLDLAAKEGHVGCVMLLMGEKDEAAAKAYIDKARQMVKDEVDVPKGDVEEEKVKSSRFEVESLSEEDAQQRAALLLSNTGEISVEVRSKGDECKAQGNEHFKKKEYEQAIDGYTAAIEHVPIEATYYSNRSACYMAMKKYEEALYDAVMTRTLKPDWPKACFRMAVARMALERYEDAAVSAWEGLQKDDSNSELKDLLQKCVRRGRKDHFEKKDADKQ